VVTVIHLPLVVVGGSTPAFPSVCRASTVPHRRARTGRDHDKDAALLAGAAIAAR
jgi:hypothetical protein